MCIGLTSSIRVTTARNSTATVPRPRDGTSVSTSGCTSKEPVLSQTAQGVLIHESEFCQSNAVVVQGRAAVLLVDPRRRGEKWFVSRATCPIRARPL
jgi:hypothetical protein